jgi:hypothetical protein
MADERPPLRQEIHEVARQKAELEGRGSTVTRRELLEHLRFKVSAYQRVVAEGQGGDDAPRVLAEALDELRRLEPAQLGPLETEPRPAWADVPPGLGSHRAPNLKRLHDALAGLQLGTYDHHIADWLSNSEPATVEVIASWIDRARQYGREGW